LGALRLLAFDHGDKIVVDGLTLVLSCLLLVVLLGSSAGALVVATGAFLLWLSCLKNTLLTLLNVTT
jgi:hypothetical protein